MRILVIEDDLEAQRYLVQGLKESGHVVDEAADGDTGLNLALSRAYDVAVVDRMLPRLEGLPSGQTCWRRLDEWERAGVWAALLERLQQRLAEAERIDWSRAIVDASLVDAKRGAPRSRAASAAAPAAVST